MHWAEKVQRLMDERKLWPEELNRRAGIADLARDMQRQSDIQIGKAIRIAKALGVSADWLYDPDQDWPPPELYMDLGHPGDERCRRNVLAVFERVLRAVQSALQAAGVEGRGSDDRPDRR